MSGGADTTHWDHGGPEPGDRIRLDIDASTTVNPFLSQDLRRCLEGSILESRSYPDPWATDCRKVIGGRHSLPPENIVVGPGATMLLYQLLQDEAFGRLILSEPVFSEYARGGLGTGKKILRVPPGLDLPLGNGESLRWGIDLLSLAPGVRSGDLLVLVNPVNPTGQEFREQDISKLLHTIRKEGGCLLVDESFQDFIDNRSSVLSLAGTDGLIVLRSFTKVSGLPGIRAGFLAGPEGLVSRVRARMGPWSLGQSEQRLIRWAVERRNACEFGWRESEKTRLFSSLGNLGVPCVRGEGPMILARPGWSEERARGIKSRLLEKGVRIRLAEGFGPSEGATLVRFGFEAFSRQEDFLGHLAEFVKGPGGSGS